MLTPNFVLTFNDQSLERWNRYWLITLLRAARHGGATAQQALAAVDRPYSGFVEGGGGGGSEAAGLGHWVACEIGDGRVLVALAGDGSASLGWYAAALANPLAAVAGVPGKVNGLWASLAAGLATALAAALGGSPGSKPTYYIAAHGAAAAVAQVLAWKLAAANPGVGIQLMGFGAPCVGNATFTAGFGAVRNVQTQNPWDPVPDCLAGSQQTLAAGLGGSLSGVADYAQPAGRNVWREGFGFAFDQAYLPGGTFLLGVPVGFGLSRRRPQFVQLSAEYQVRNATASCWSHLPYYYALGYWADTLTYLGTAANRQQVGEARGYDLGALDALNGTLSVQDGYALTPEWPVSPAPGP